MKKIIVSIIIISLAVAAAFWLSQKSKTNTLSFNQPNPAANQKNLNPMKLESPAFEPNKTIPAKYTCDGDNINPPLKISGVPEQAQSLALVVNDPDAGGSGWVHWEVWNISPAAAEIAEGKVPVEATQGTTSFGTTGYGGPCPPAGPAHRYVFTLYALAGKLSLPSRITKDGLAQAMNGLVIDQAELVGSYQRK